MRIEKRILVLLSVLVLFTVSAVPQDSQVQARKLFEDGASAFKSNNWLSAESAFKQSYEQKAFPITAYFLSCTYARMGNASEAGRFAELALNGTPTLRQEYIDGANRILQWSNSGSSVDTDSKLDSFRRPPNFPNPTEATLPEPSSVVVAAPPAMGGLIRGSGPEVFMVIAGSRHWIPNESTFDALGLDWNAVQSVPDSRLNDIPRGADYPSLSHRLVKGSGPATFLLEGGWRRWIPDEQTFNARGFHWDDIQTISDEELNSIPVGAS